MRMRGSQKKKRTDLDSESVPQWPLLFLSSREGEEVSAVCVFSLSDINKVLNGPFKELKKSENWINADLVPTPRPGQVRNQNDY